MEDIRRPWSSDSTLEIYSAVSGNWSAIPLDYCRVTAEGIGKGFRAWDTVTVQGTAAKQGGQFEELDGDRIVYEVQEDWLLVKATPGGRISTGNLPRTAPPPSGPALMAARWPCTPWRARCRWNGKSPTLIL